MDAESGQKPSSTFEVEDTKPTKSTKSTKSSPNNWKDETMRSSVAWKEETIRSSTIRRSEVANTASVKQESVKQEQLLSKRGSILSRNTVNQLSSNSGMARLSTAMGFQRAPRVSAYDISLDQEENVEIVEDIWDSLNKIDMDINVRTAGIFLFSYRISCPVWW